MARIKSVQDYDPSIPRAIRVAARLGVFIIPCPDTRSARALRGVFYAFRYALRQEGDSFAEVADKLHFEIDGAALILRTNVTAGATTVTAALTAQGVNND